MDADWGAPTELTEDGIYTLQPLVTDGEAFRILLGTDEAGEKDEYLLLENRQRLLFDVDLYGTGLAIYQVDDAAPGQRNKGYPGQVDDMGNAWPENGNHYMVAMLQADGLYDLEQATDYGDRGDLWQPGQVLGPGSGGTVFPNTDRYQGGKIEETGITITILEPDNDLEVKFQVEGLRQSGGGGDNSGSEGDASTEIPTVAPIEETSSPTATPTNTPTTASSKTTPAPSKASTDPPTKSPTEAPTILPTLPTTDNPTLTPGEPTASPTSALTTSNPESPTEEPTVSSTITTNASTSSPTSPSSASEPTIASSTGEPSPESNITNIFVPTTDDNDGTTATDGETDATSPPIITTSSPTRAPVFAVDNLSAGGNEQSATFASGSSLTLPLCLWSATMTASLSLLLQYL